MTHVAVQGQRQQDTGAGHNGHDTVVAQDPPSWKRVIRRQYIGHGGGNDQHVHDARAKRIEQLKQAKQVKTRSAKRQFTQCFVGKTTVCSTCFDHECHRVVGEVATDCDRCDSKQKTTLPNGVG